MVDAVVVRRVGGRDGGGDQLFPKFIMTQMPAGLAGLVLSAILSAAMSSLSSGVNSACAVLEKDFLSRRLDSQPSAAAAVARLTWLTKILGFSQGITDDTPDDFTHEVAIPLQPGDAVAHHGMTIHRADANLSATRHRRSFAMVFKGGSCQRDEAAYARYLAAARDQLQELGLKTC